MTTCCDIKFDWKSELLEHKKLLYRGSGKSLYNHYGDQIVVKMENAGFVCTKDSYRLTWAAMGLCEQDLSLEVFSKVIDSLILKNIRKGGDIQINVLADSLATSIVTQKTDVYLFEPLELLCKMETALSATPDFGIDKTLTFDVIHVGD